MSAIPMHPMDFMWCSNNFDSLEKLPSIVVVSDPYCVYLDFLFLTTKKFEQKWPQRIGNALLILMSLNGCWLTWWYQHDFMSCKFPTKNCCVDWKLKWFFVFLSKILWFIIQIHLLIIAQNLWNYWTPHVLWSSSKMILVQQAVVSIVFYKNWNLWI